MRYVETLTFKDKFAGYFNNIPLYGGVGGGAFYPLFTTKDFISDEAGVILFSSGTNLDPFSVVKDFRVVEINGYACMYRSLGLRSVTIYSNDSRGFYSSFTNIQDGLFYVDKNNNLMSDDFLYPYPSLDEACKYFFENQPSIKINVIREKLYRSDIYSVSDSVSAYDIYFNYFEYIGMLCAPSCCYPDFAPIVAILGGTPSTDQVINLKSICYLLGVDTSENGLSACDLMKEYLKRLNQILGSSSLSLEPNVNLKSICYLLGVDTFENGLQDCELSKEYVKRIGVALGVQYA